MGNMSLRAREERIMVCLYKSNFLSKFAGTKRSPVKIIGLKSLGIGIALNMFALPLYRAQASPPQELERLSYFAGQWICQQPADSNKASGEFSWNVELGLNDFWYLGQGSQTQTPANGQPINTQEFLGYDSAAGKLTRSVVVGNGNSYSLTADDWESDRLVWQGTISMQGKSTPLRQEMVRDSPDSLTTTYFVLGKDDAWLPIVDEGCDRQLPE